MFMYPEQLDGGDKLSCQVMANCYLCGAVATTIDHVPPQCFFEVLPANVIELPACATCNGSASLDEEYIRATLAAEGYATSAVARKVWEGAVKRSFEYRPKGLKARLARAVVTVEIRTPAGDVAGYLPGIKTDGKRALNVMKKIARGIYFQEQGRKLGDDELLLFRDGDTKGLNFEVITRAWPEIDMGEPFRYRRQHSEEGSIIWFEFYRTTWWLAMTGELARNYNQK